MGQFSVGGNSQELKGIRVLHWVISSIRDTSASFTTLRVEIQVEVAGRRDKLSADLRMMYADPSFEVIVRGMAEGQWYVMPNLTTDLWVKKLQLEAQ